MCGDPYCSRCYPGGNPDIDDDQGDGMLGASWSFANPERAATIDDEGDTAEQGRADAARDFGR
jgi:hypothetical protein